MPFLQQNDPERYHNYKSVNYLSLENVTKTYGEKVLFLEVSLQINKGQKVALVAKNGSGKSTLLRVAGGKENSEGAHNKVLIHRDARLGYLEQEPDFYPEHTILEAVLVSSNPLILAIKRYEHSLLFKVTDEEAQAAVARMEDLKAWDFEARIKEILGKLGFIHLEQTVGTLSGGQKKRLALAKMIIDEPDLLILDEPTNHLDLDMIEWLEEYLNQPNLTILMVTHDRYFLERVCDTIVELDRGQLYRYTGNYTAFLEKKSLRNENENIDLEKSRKWLRKELDWVNRMPKARSTKAKSRVDGFYEVKEKVSNVKSEKELQIDIKGQRLGKKILEAQYISKRYGDQVIVHEFAYKFQKGERVGIVGPNGVGKSTFLKMLTQEVRPDEGRVIVGGNTVFGHYSQDGIAMAEDKRVIDVVREIAEFIPLEKGQKLTAEQLLERFLFDRKHQQVYISQLSGGEKRRLYLLTVLMQNPNFLILDEPTNDLDIITLNVLEEFLMEFPGCILIVSHDRFFLDKLSQHLFIFEGEGKIRDFNGNYTEYRDIKREEDAEKKDRERGQSSKETKQAPAPPTGGGLTFDQRKEMNRLEKEISRLETQKTEIEAQFAEPGISATRITELAKSLNTVKMQLEEKEMRWMELAELA